MRNHRERGMTLLEIMIVLAILAIIMGLVVGPAVMGHHGRAMEKTTKIKLHKLAYEAYPQWATTSHQICPASLADLTEYMNEKSVTDAWGNKLEMTCGATNPPGVVGLGLRSPGKDGKLNTEDDIVSWD